MYEMAITSRRTTTTKAVQTCRILAVAIAMGFSAVASATVINWTNTVGGVFDSSANWSPNQKPVAGDEATFNAGGSYSVIFTANEACDTNTVGGTDQVTLALGGFTYKTDTGAGNNIKIGNAAGECASLTVQNGTLDNNGASLPRILVGGASSTGKLTIANGGVVQYNYFTLDADGLVASEVVVDGAGSSLTGGGGGFTHSRGTLTVKNGGQATLANYSQLGGISDANVVIDGAGSKITTYAGAPRVLASSGYSTVDIINGGEWNTSGQFEVGVWFGSGTATIGNGVSTSKVVAGDVFLVGFPGDLRSVVEVKVNSGGLIQTTTAANSVRVTDGDTFTLNGGTVELPSAGQFNVQDIDAGASKGLLRGSGTIQRSSGSSFTLTSDGYLRPGDTNATARIGTLAVTDGSLTNNAGGTMFFELASDACDQVAISNGTATIGGTVTFLNMVGFTPAKGMGTAWDFVTADDITYTASDNMTSLMSGFGLTVDVDYTFGVVSVSGGKALRLDIPEAGDGPAINNLLGPTNITTTGVTFQGALTATGTAQTAVYVFYGTANGNTNKTGAGAWQNSALVDADAATGTVSYTTNALTTDRMYVYRLLASNQFDEAWGNPVQSFLPGEVSVVASDPGATEGGDTGTFTISRAATATNGTLTVFYSVGGTATPGSDFDSIGSDVTLNEGVASTIVTVTALSDAESPEPDETVVLTLEPGRYVIGPSSSATVTIVNVAFAWTNASGGAFSDAGNWSHHQVPTAADAATFGLGAGADYTVDFSAAAAGAYVEITDHNAVVFDLGGNTYTVNNGGPELYVGSNATDNVRLTITDGTFTTASGGGRVIVGANSSTGTLVIGDSGGGPGKLIAYGTPGGLNAIDIGANGTVIVSGPGCYLGANNAGGTLYGMLIVSNGAGAVLPQNMDAWGGFSSDTVIHGAGSVLTNWTGSSRFSPSASKTLRVKSGGRAVWLGTFNMNISSGAAKTYVGDGMGTSVLQCASVALGFDGTRGFPELIVNSGGIVHASSASGTSILVDGRSTLTMNAGNIEMAGGAALSLQTGGQALLRGSGTITRHTGTAGFTISNGSAVRPGDTNVTARIGTLSVAGGNLTNDPGGTIYLDFDSAGGDQIAISNGTATVEGTVTFTNMIGFAPAASMGKAWDFLTADDIAYTASDNMTSLMSGFGLTVDVDYTFGVVARGSGKALRLYILPPKGTLVIIR